MAGIEVLKNSEIEIPADAVLVVAETVASQQPCTKLLVASAAKSANFLSDQPATEPFFAALVLKNKKMEIQTDPAGLLIDRKDLKKRALADQNLKIKKCLKLYAVTVATTA